MTRRPRPVSPDEARLFHESLKDVAPLALRKRKPRIAPPTVPPKAASPTIPPAPPPKPKPDAPRRQPFAPLDHGVAADIDKRTFERFRKGEMGIDATLDLHGMTRMPPTRR